VLYGTTVNGGSSAFGTVFSLTPPAAPGGAWTEAVLHNFAGPPSDGYALQAGLVIGKGGVLYGTTWEGGTVPCLDICGTVFSLTPPAAPGGAWTEAVLYSFTGGSDGDAPGGVVIGNGGVLYGTTQFGGASNVGTVFSLTPPAAPGGAWTEAVLHSFTGSPNDGADPEGVVIDVSGVLYGTTQSGGSSAFGTVFSLTPPAAPGGMWTETKACAATDANARAAG